MDLNINNIEKGMDVFGSDGEKVGTVAEVYTGSASSSGFSQGMSSTGDVVVEEVDVVAVAPGSAATGVGVSDTGTSAMGSSGMTSTSAGSSAGGTVSPPDTGDTTWNAGLTEGGNAASGAGMSGAGTTGYNTGMNTTGDIGAIGTANDQNTSPGYVPASTGGVGTPTLTGAGYIHVQSGGILGIGSKDLYIPVGAVQDVDPGNCVSLNITKQQADSEYQTQPDDLGTAHE